MHLHYLLLAFLIGLAAGAGLMLWLCWAEFHARLDLLESRIKQHVSAVETSIANRILAIEKCGKTPGIVMPAEVANAKVESAQL